MRASVASGLLVLLVACGESGGLDTPAECNPLDDGNCVSPYPSMIYAIADDTSATGVRLDIAPGAFPANWDGAEIDPTPFNSRDGFTAASQIFTFFPGNVDPTGLVHHDDFPASLTDASPTVLIDMDRGERVAHFAEIDANANPDYDDQALYIRPATRLHGSTRYAVGIRKSLQAYGGGSLPISAGFQAILDGDVTEHERLERVRPRYDDIFAAFAAQGIARDDLVVAWDFTTASDAAVAADLLGARDAALVAMGELAANMSYEISADEPYGDGSQIVRLIEGSFEVPMVLDDEDPRTGRLARDADGTPMVVGKTWATFAALVPTCALEQRPVPIMLFGHGFFGDLAEVKGGYLRRVAADLCVVVVGTMWRGMSADDVAAAALALNDANKILTYGERIIQGMLNYFTLAQLVRGALASEVLADDDGPLVDPSKLSFYGISQGHILGATFMAYDPFIERGVLAVGGGNWSLLFERSTHWGHFGLMLGGAYPGIHNKVILQALMQMAFDPTENIHMASRIFADPIPGTPAKQLLLHMAIGDCQVGNLSTEYQARTLGIPTLAPAFHQPYGIAEEAGPLTSGLVMWDEKLDFTPPTTNLLNQVDNETHDSVRRYSKVVEQIGIFVETGEIIHTCGDTPCDCAASACGDKI